MNQYNAFFKISELVLAAVGLRYCAQTFSSCSERGYSLFVAHGHNCPEACGVFPDQELNPCALHGRQILNHWATREVQDSAFLPAVLNIRK